MSNIFFMRRYFNGQAQVDLVDLKDEIAITMHSTTMGQETRTCCFSTQQVSDLYSALGKWLKKEKGPTIYSGREDKCQKRR